MILGTPRYMSPEQAKGETIDGRSDLFSLGVILYELLTGHKAFDAESIPTLIMQIIQKNPAPIRQYYPDAPAGLQGIIIAKLLQKKPEKRFQSGAELYDALEKELRVLQDDDAKDYLPMQIKWTALMGGVVALIMVVSVLVVFRVQSGVLSDQVIMADTIHHSEDGKAVQEPRDPAAAPDGASQPKQQFPGGPARKDPATSSGDYTIIDTRINDPD